jgi:medium-chain acyl-[acyl-carrier-protein] hydrolase
MRTQFHKKEFHDHMKLSLFCFHHAGGNSSLFRKWLAWVPEKVQVCPVELAGHGARLGEVPVTKLSKIVLDLSVALAPKLISPFVFFGHSMGALIAFELARLLQVRYALSPVCLFAAGTRAPHLPRKDRLTYNLPDAELIAELRRLNGTPDEVLDNPEVLELVLPVIRADLEAVETYSCGSGLKLTCPVKVYGGEEDKGSTREDLEAWSVVTSGAFSIRMVAGDHFFVNSSAFVEVLKDDLTPVLNQGTPKGAVPTHFGKCFQII